jgi:hypothetical protein
MHRKQPRIRHRGAQQVRGGEVDAVRREIDELEAI